MRYLIVVRLHYNSGFFKKTAIIKHAYSEDQARKLAEDVFCSFDNLVLYEIVKIVNINNLNKNYSNGN